MHKLTFTEESRVLLLNNLTPIHQLWCGAGIDFSHWRRGHVRLKAGVYPKYRSHLRLVLLTIFKKGSLVQERMSVKSLNIVSYLRVKVCRPSDAPKRKRKSRLASALQCWTQITKALIFMVARVGFHAIFITTTKGAVNLESQKSRRKKTSLRVCDRFELVLQLLVNNKSSLHMDPWDALKREDIIRGKHFCFTSPLILDKQHINWNFLHVWENWGLGVLRRAPRVPQATDECFHSTPDTSALGYVTRG